jgi:hypothetical protein
MSIDNNIFTVNISTLTGSIPQTQYGEASNSNYSSAFTSLNFNNDQNLIIQSQLDNSGFIISRTN